MVRERRPAGFLDMKCQTCYNGRQCGFTGAAVLTGSLVCLVSLLAMREASYIVRVHA